MFRKYIRCPQKYSPKGFRLPDMEIGQLHNPCYLNANEIDIENSIINVDNTVVYLIGKNIKLLNNKFYGHNQVIRIIADKIELTQNEFIGKNRTFEAVGVNIYSMLNAHKGHTSKVIKTGAYIKESKNVHFGNDQYHKITGVALSEVRDEHSEVLPLMQLARLVIVRTGDVHYQDEFFINRDNCMYDGNNQTQIMHATKVKDRANFFIGHHQIHRETGKNVTTTLNWYVGEDIIHTINGVAQKDDLL
ncbi:EP1-1 [Diolcogaster facetosa bracovirus]|uniref:EP1-1 n=1 Tax=Bracoviriform facetosae TaxID=2083300 RepID=R9XNI6_9VIRU|nr:EP1-1 [Diolcogaster facetosa bracovirus] [Bracoviriform facetosae]YP_009665885.1 EP1-1 [Diolcogaster facetosa bracovirus] [Bracoviriform facetosae]AGO14400.1 EP1-1 [Diolcogaster facetosa bracovirus] [Bracoviriform facetosae]AGO14473.1 EP1-1 [Diolcogaster facetosa bracovirus] [Bracoviriform facetosae]